MSIFKRLCTQSELITLWILHIQQFGFCAVLKSHFRCFEAQVESRWFSFRRAAHVFTRRLPPQEFIPATRPSSDSSSLVACVTLLVIAWARDYVISAACVSRQFTHACSFEAKVSLFVRDGGRNTCCVNTAESQSEGLFLTARQFCENFTRS